MVSMNVLARRGAEVGGVLIGLNLDGCGLRACLPGNCEGFPGIPVQGPHQDPLLELLGTARADRAPAGWSTSLGWRGPGADTALDASEPVVLHTGAHLRDPALEAVAAGAIPDAPTRYLGWRRGYRDTGQQAPLPDPGEDASGVPAALPVHGGAYLTLMARTPLGIPGGVNQPEFVRFVHADVEGLGGGRYQARFFRELNGLGDARLELAGSPPGDAPASTLELRNEPWLEQQILGSVPWPTDGRFTGIYQGSGSFELEVSLSRSFLGIPLGTSTETVRFDLETIALSLLHTGAERPDFAGTLLGRMGFEGEASSLAECITSNEILVAGEVVREGLARLVLGFELTEAHDEHAQLTLVQRYGGGSAWRALAPGLSLVIWAELSPDGETLILSGLGEELALTKTGPHNAHPVPRIVHPADGTELAHGVTHHFAGEVDDPELARTSGPTDGSPPQPLYPTFDDAIRAVRWSYRRADDPNAHFVPFGTPVLAAAPGAAPSLLVASRHLPAGRLQVRMEAVDHGGLVGRDEIEVLVRAAAPLAPDIVLPEPRDTLCRGQRVFLQARGYAPGSHQPSIYDAQGQHVAGPRLLWESDLEALTVGGAPLEGNDLQHGFQVAGTHTLTCIAVNPDGGRARSQVEVSVVECPGNAAPRIRFVTPPVVKLGTSVASERGLPFLARVEVADTEDADDQLEVAWTLTALQTPTPEPPITASGVDRLEFSHLFPDDGRSSTDVYSLQAVVRDSAGARDAVSLRIVVRSPDQIVE